MFGISHTVTVLNAVFKKKKVGGANGKNRNEENKSKGKKIKPLIFITLARKLFNTLLYL